MGALHAALSQEADMTKRFEHLVPEIILGLIANDGGAGQELRNAVTAADAPGSSPLDVTSFLREAKLTRKSALLFNDLPMTLRSDILPTIPTSSTSTSTSTMNTTLTSPTTTTNTTTSPDQDASCVSSSSCESDESLVDDFIRTGCYYASGCLVIDVRSPGEFQQGRIPGAVNVPLFSDEERATVGTIYKKKVRQPVERILVTICNVHSSLLHHALLCTHIRT